MKIFRVFSLLLGLILILNSLVLFAISNYNLGLLLELLLGIILLSIGIFYKPLKVITSHGVMKLIKYAFYIICLVGLFMVSFLFVYGQNDTINYNEDAVIVLGAGVNGDQVPLTLQYRLDKAIEAANKNSNAVIVVSGGQGPQETVTEAFAMEKYLVSQGIDKNRIIKEEKSTSTFENFKFTKEILDSKFKNDYKIVYITNGFHIYRAGEIAKKAGYKNVTHFHGEIEWYNYGVTYLREVLAVAKMWVFGV